MLSYPHSFQHSSASKTDLGESIARTKEEGHCLDWWSLTTKCDVWMLSESLFKQTNYKKTTLRQLGEFYCRQVLGNSVELLSFFPCPCCCGYVRK